MFHDLEIGSQLGRDWSCCSSRLSSARDVLSYGQYRDKELGVRSMVVETLTSLSDLPLEFLPLHYIDL